MTDSSSTSHSHLAQSAQATLESNLANTHLAGTATALVVPEEPVEDFTIKCICGQLDAEQHSVYCENCDTWQHTECYYIDATTGVIPTTEELRDIEHLCVDCKPRNLDVKGAIDRQRARQEEFEFNEKKIRKNAAKSHKKKSKVPETNGALTNGWIHGGDVDAAHERTSRSPRETAPAAKRPKTSHRASNSTTIPSVAQHASSSSHKRAASHAHSPSKPPHRRVGSGDEADRFSAEFLRLYDNDPGDSPLQTNLLNDIQITSDLALWSNDIEALRKATPKFSHPDIFQRTQDPISSMQMPVLRKQEKVAEEITVNGRNPKWVYLTIDSWTPKGAPVGEIKGKIGHMTEYIKNPTNRWEYLRHPAPFVFFHPKLPIYIDTRSEGTKCRYLRRSCNPNLVMKTFLENGSEYHFCFVAQCDLDPGSELTIGWVLDENMRRFFGPKDNGAKQDMGADEDEYVADWASKVLPEFGGCACGGTTRCTWDRFLKRGRGFSKSRNGYPKVTAGTSMGNHMTNSREGSDQEDRMSLSGSKSTSRDESPSDHVLGDSTFGPGLEISAREKRKIAALENNDKNQPATKKKKRNSGGPNSNTPNLGSSKQPGATPSSISQPTTPYLSSKSQYIDSSTSRRRSGSPIPKPFSSTPGRPKTSTVSRSKHPLSAPGTPSAVAAPPRPRNTYVNQAVQTEDQDEDDLVEPTPVAPLVKRPYVSLTKRLLIRSQQERHMLEQRRRASLDAQPSPPKIVNVKPSGVNASDVPLAQVDTPMLDIASSPISASSVILQAGSMEPPSPEHHNGLEVEATRAPATQTSPLQSTPNPTDDLPHDVNGLGSSDPPAPPPHKPPDNIPNNNHIVDASRPPIVPQPPPISGATSPSPATANNTAAAATAVPVGPPPSVALPPPSATTGAPNIQPSPATKKMSLSDYIRRKGSTSANDKSVPAGAELQASAAALKSLNVSGAVGAAAISGTGGGLVNGDGKAGTGNGAGAGAGITSGSSEEHAILDSPRKEIPDPLGTATAVAEPGKAGAAGMN